MYCNQCFGGSEAVDCGMNYLRTVTQITQLLVSIETVLQSMLWW